MNRPRVALVSLSPLAVGGIETHLLQLIAGLRDAYSFQVIGTIAEPFATQAAALGAECIPLPPGGQLDLGMILRLRMEFRRGRYSLIHTHDTRSGLLGRIAAKLAGIPALHTVHTPSFFLPKSPAKAGLYRAMERLLNNHFSSGVIFVSPTIQEIYRSGKLIRASKAHLIVNGLEPEWLRLRRKASGRGRGINFLYVGRLAPEKGLPLLAEGFSRIAPGLPSAHLQIVGDGPLREAVLEIARRDGWMSRLYLPGRLDREQTRRILRSADIFVLPSRFESMPYTLLEAMACGLPCIATDVGGSRDLVADGVTGLLVPSMDADALAGAMRRLAKSAVLRSQMGDAARQRAREFPLGKMLDATRNVYRDLVRNLPSTKPI
jgi:glycosyltransferase involved in cell wall biosynthesis